MRQTREDMPASTQQYSALGTETDLCGSSSVWLKAKICASKQAAYLTFQTWCRPSAEPMRRACCSPLALRPAIPAVLWDDPEAGDRPQAVAAAVRWTRWHSAALTSPVVCQRNAGGVRSSTCVSRENSRRCASVASAPSRLLNDPLCAYLRRPSQ